MYYYAIMDKEDGIFGVHFPDFPGCVAVGDTEDEALASARQALAFHVDGMREDGEAIPAATSLEEIRHHTGVDAGHVITAIPLVSVLGKAVRVNLSIDAGKLAAIDTEAKARGLTRSAFIVAAALEEIG